MRGTPLIVDRHHGITGIIPAYAGNTSMPSETPLPRRDHPRICGEHLIFDRWPVRVTGSSPHMRGTPNIRPLAGKGDGIIPAYAGNTTARAISDHEGRDHPRICGEHERTWSYQLSTMGSSPHMRGTPAITPPSDRLTGIIPAYAGNTLRDYSNFVVSKFMSFVFHLV